MSQNRTYCVQVILCLSKSLQRQHKETSGPIDLHKGSYVFGMKQINITETPEFKVYYKRTVSCILLIHLKA